MRSLDYNKLEAKRAKADGATVVNNSGRGQYAKGDAKTDELLIDYKFTEKGSFSVNLKKFEKHEKDGRDRQRQGMYVVEFTEDVHNKRLAIVEWGYLQELQDFYERHNATTDDS